MTVRAIRKERRQPGAIIYRTGEAGRRRMVPAEQVIIVTAAPLLGYRLREAAVKIPGIVVIGPLRIAEEALEQGRHSSTTLYLCDEPSAHHLLKHWPAWSGWIIRITENPDPPEPADEAILVTLSLQDPVWQTRLHRLLAAAAMVPDAALARAANAENPDGPLALPRGTSALWPARPERRSAWEGGLAAILPDGRREMLARLSDPITALLGAGAFDEILRLLPALRIPAYMLFVDITGAPPPLRPVQRWYDHAGLRLRGGLRADDLVFRLDTSLFAALAGCSTEDHGEIIATRLRWIISQPEGVRVERIVHAGALWRPGDPIHELVPRAWSQAFRQPIEQEREGR